MIQPRPLVICHGFMPLCRTYPQCEREIRSELRSKPSRPFCVTSIRHTNGAPTSAKQKNMTLAVKNQCQSPKIPACQPVNKFKTELLWPLTRWLDHSQTSHHHSGIFPSKHQKRAVQEVRMKISLTSHNLTWAGTSTSQLWTWKLSSQYTRPSAHQDPDNAPCQVVIKS